MSQVTKSNKTDLTAAFIEQYSLFSQKLADGGQSALRQAAIDSFAEQGLPANKAEEYKYTPITRRLEKHFNSIDLTVTPTPEISAELEQQIKNLMVNTEANQLVFVNGHFVESLSTVVSPAEEITILPIEQALTEGRQGTDTHFGQLAKIDSDPFVALNTAMAQQGIYIHVPKSKVVEKPVLIYFFSDTAAGKVVTHPRNFFVIEENAQVQVAETFKTIGSDVSYSNAVSEIVVEQAAQAYYCKYEDESEQAYHTGTTEVSQEKNSHFHGTTVALKGSMIRNNLNAALNDEYCESHMYGLYMLDGETHVDNHTSVDHKKPNAFSNELYKGIMDGQSKGVFNGKIFVRPNAQKTNAFQSNANILLTDEASIDTKPQLEIWADDVKCSHGATTGQLDSEQMFYLRARGLSKVQARAVLLKAFAGDVIQHIKIDALREVIEQVISQRLEKEL